MDSVVKQYPDECMLLGPNKFKLLDVEIEPLDIAKHTYTLLENRFTMDTWAKFAFAFSYHHAKRDLWFSPHLYKELAVIVDRDKKVWADERKLFCLERNHIKYQNGDRLEVNELIYVSGNNIFKDIAYCVIKMADNYSDSDLLASYYIPNAVATVLSANKVRGQEVNTVLVAVYKEAEENFDIIWLTAKRYPVPFIKEFEVHCSSSKTLHKSLITKDFSFEEDFVQCNPFKVSIKTKG